MSRNDTIQNILGKIKQQNEIVRGFQQVRAATNNPDVISRAESGIRDARKAIEYFEKTLRELQGHDDIGNGIAEVNLNGKGYPSMQTGRGTREESDYGAPGPGGYSGGGAPGLMPPRAPYAPAGPQDRSPAKRPNYSKLGMLSLKDLCRTTNTS